MSIALACISSAMASSRVQTRRLLLTWLLQKGMVVYPAIPTVLTFKLADVAHGQVWLKAASVH